MFLRFYQEYFMNLTEFAKLPPAKIKGIPMIRYVGGGFTGAMGASKVMDTEDLEGRLARGMKDDEIEKLVETESGEKLVDKYINKKFNEGKHVERMSGGVFNRKLPNGNWSKAIQFDPHTGQQLPGQL